MHNIEPFFNWLHLYSADKDEYSPFYGNEYSEFEYTNKIYNYAIHPQWEQFGSSTLLLKLLFVDYTEGYAIIELMGEWNDCISNDMMLLKREVLDVLINNGVEKIIFMMDNVLNFHGSDDAYYAEFWEDTPEGWAILLELKDHIYKEMLSYGIDDYFNLDEEGEGIVNWRMMKPEDIYSILRKNAPVLIN